MWLGFPRMIEDFPCAEGFLITASLLNHKVSKVLFGCRQRSIRTLYLLATILRYAQLFNSVRQERTFHFVHSQILAEIAHRQCVKTLLLFSSLLF